MWCAHVVAEEHAQWHEGKQKQPGEEQETVLEGVDQGRVILTTLSAVAASKFDVRDQYRNR
jgi:hypothetical protein